MDEHRRKKEALVAEIDNSIRAGLESVGSDPEAEFKLLAEIYSSLLQTVAKKFAGSSNYDLGSRDYDIKKSSMLLTFGFTDKKFTEFLDYLKQRFYLIPETLKSKMTVYVGEHDKFSESPAAKIKEQRFERINDSKNVPAHDDDSLSHEGGEFEKLRNIGFQLRDRLRELVEVE